MLGYLAQAGEETFQGDPDADLTQQRASQKGIESYILDSNPLLEAFGNAKTFRNANSSRFGKFLDVEFRLDTGKIHSANIVTYLLEKSRVVSHLGNERSFHIFYQLLANDELRARFDLNAAPQSYKILKSETDTYTVDGVNDQEVFEETLGCMKSIDFTDEEVECIWQILVAILHLGNVTCTENDNDEVSVDASSRDELLKAADLLALDRTLLEKMMTMKVA